MTGSVLPLPPPYADRFTVFERHYIYHQSRLVASGSHRKRPSIGELMMTSGLKRSTVRQFRRRYEDDLRLLQANALRGRANRTQSAGEDLL